MTEDQGDDIHQGPRWWHSLRTNVVTGDQGDDIQWGPRWWRSSRTKIMTFTADQGDDWEPRWWHSLRTSLPDVLHRGPMSLNTKMSEHIHWVSRCQDTVTEDQCVRTHSLDTRTKVSKHIHWVSGHIHWVSGHVYWVSGLIHWVSGYIHWGPRCQETFTEDRGDCMVSGRQWLLKRPCTAVDMHLTIGKVPVTFSNGLELGGARWYG